MKFHCWFCGGSFTTFQLPPGQQTMFRHFATDKMKCRHCKSSTIQLARECQTRLVKDKDGYETVCDNCPEKFNCLTGNIDDGSKKRDLAKEQEDREKEISERGDYIKEYKIKERVRNLAEYLSKRGFKFFTRNGNSYAKFRVTTWKLTTEDKRGIMYGRWWDTDTTSKIANAVVKGGISPFDIHELFTLIVTLKEMERK